MHPRRSIMPARCIRGARSCRPDALTALDISLLPDYGNWFRLPGTIDQGPSSAVLTGRDYAVAGGGRI
jgi:hypothetical protein